MDKKIISMLVLGLLLGGGAIGAYQVAAQNNNAVKTTTAVQQQEVQDPSYHGSIVIGGAKYEGKNERDESAALVGKAKITAEQAKKVAEAKVSGTVTGAKLGNENGSLVYEIKIGKQEVKVDAGNGTVLKIEQADNEKGGKEAVGNEKAGVENEKGGNTEKDGILHQFKGQEEHTD